MQRKALAQIPLILGLLVMAIAIPVATRLVQQEQDKRSSAADQTCNSSKPCPAGQRCVSGRCVPTATVAPTSVPQTCTGRCYRNGQSCPCGYAAGNCQDDDICCRICPTNSPRPTTRPTTGPTVRPTTRPTATPMPCANTGQACSTRNCCRTTDVCTDEGFSYPRCVPRDQIPTYIPEPTPSCANTGQACSTRSCCHTTDVCTDEGFSYPRCVPRFPTSTPRPTARPTSRPTAVVTRVPTQSPSDKCPGAQACPDSTGKILRDCVKPDNDGTSRDSICAVAGEKDTCGGKDYCCPTAGGKWTTDMTKCPAANCTQCTNDPGAKGKGDADCSRFTNLTDYLIWKEEYIAGDLGASVKNTWRADFNCDGKVDLVNDYLIWKNYYITTLQ